MVDTKTILVTVSLILVVGMLSSIVTVAMVGTPEVEVEPQQQQGKTLPQNPEPQTAETTNVQLKIVE